MKASRGIVTAVALAAVTLVAPAEVPASTARMPCALDYGTCGFFYEASAGERNQVQIGWATSGPEGTPVQPTLVVFDPGAVIAAGDSCAVTDPHLVRCTVPPSNPDRPPLGVDRRIDTGDLEDSVSFGLTDPSAPQSRTIVTEVKGGPGTDTLYASSSSRLYGGDGDDTLYGSTAGFAALAGNDGDDTLYAGAVGPLSGGIGVDRLVGGGGDDVLSGGVDDDVLLGSGGDDQLHGGSGNDLLDAGEGDDWLVAGSRTGDLDTNVCGPGLDTSGTQRAADTVPGDCERVSFLRDYEFGIWFTLNAQPYRWERRSVRFDVPCAHVDSGLGFYGSRPCRGTLVVREAGGRHRLIGRGAVPERNAKVRLTRTGIRLVRAPRGVRATVTITAEAGRIPAPSAWTIRLRRGVTLPRGDGKHPHGPGEVYDGDNP